MFLCGSRDASFVFMLMATGSISVDAGYQAAVAQT